MQTTSIYIHYPYCLSKCHYCDFASYPCLNKKTENLKDFYLSELENFHTITKGYNISSIYFGGGTPSLMETKTLDAIMQKINILWGVDKNIEITIEANPKTITLEKLKDFKNIGINRVSVGIQSLNDKNLQFLGRIHNSNDALTSLEEIRKVFDNVSADFIYALPNQSFQDWQSELKKIKALNLPHLSLYELIIEENTKLYDKVIKGEISPIDEIVATDMYNFTNDFLSDTTPQYEVSSYANPTYRGNHNINYWQGGNYIGIGPASATRLNLNGHFLINENPREIYLWQNIVKNKNDFSNFLTLKERASELIIMGLRQTDGINFSTFAQHIGDSFFNFVDKDMINRFAQQKLLFLDNDNIKVSREGMLVLDTILLEIIK